LAAVASKGAFGVDVFFVLSGYLITWLLLKEEKRYGRFDAENFYIRRALRILPPAFFYLGVVSLLGVVGIFAIRPWDIIPCLFFFRSYSSGALLTIHYWSLSVEEEFYLIWPFVLLFLRSLQLRAGFVAALITFAPLWRQINYVHFGITQVDRFRSDLNYDPLLFGCLLALVRSHSGGLNIMRGRMLQSPAAPITALAVLFLTVGQIVAVPGFRFALPTIEYAAVAAFVNFAIEHRHGRLAAFLNHPLMVWSGNLSYSLYIWQQVPTEFWQGHASPIELLVGLALLFTTACFSFYVIERPFNLMRKLFGYGVDTDTVSGPDSSLAPST
jgi:peptidoglycan/LPS O-acetylase OafA/YrhL